MMTKRSRKGDAHTDTRISKTIYRVWLLGVLQGKTEDSTLYEEECCTPIKPILRYCQSVQERGKPQSISALFLKRVRGLLCISG